MTEQIAFYESLVGELWDGRYRIEKLVGIGGMSVVYRAADTQTGKTVAIKRMKEEIASQKDALPRFITEYKAISRLSHPNIVGLYEAHLDAPVKYLVMEYVEGISLRTYMDRREKPLELDEIAGYSEQILAALEHAHSRGVVHRDIKPQNIMLLKNGIVKLTDFGIAHLPDDEPAVLDDSAVGTVYYISPEQAEGGTCDNRSDLYSLGVMMYEMAAGRLPFYDKHAAAVLMMHMEKKPDPPRQYNRKVPRGLEQIILCAMEKKPEKRFESAVDMFRELRKLGVSKYASVRTPAQIRRDKRSARNRENNRPSQSMTPVIFGIAFAVLAVGIVSVFTALDRLKIGSLGTESILVPDAVGLEYVSEEDSGSREAYLSMLGALGFDSHYVVIPDYRYSNDYPEGTIIRQSPTGGASRKAPCEVTLTVSLGVETLILEDYTITDWRRAQSELRARGFTVTVVNEDNPVIESGYVINTYPLPGTEVRKGSNITLRVSNGVSVGRTVLPDFTGRSEVIVTAELKTYPFFVGDVTYTRSSRPEGEVLFQFPEADSIAFAGTTSIDFVVSGGPDFALNYFPDVTGYKADEAEEALEKLGLRVIRRTVLSETEKDTVLTMSPTPETYAKDTATVYLSVSDGGSGVTEGSVYMLDVSRGNDTYETATLKIDAILSEKAEIIYTTVVKRDNAPVGRIIGQTPAAGEKITPDGRPVEVILTVSGGPGYSVTVTVPQLVGLSEPEAAAALEEAGIVPVPLYFADHLPIGSVTAQEYASGTSLYGLEGAITCTFTVCMGPDYREPEETTDVPAGPEVPGPEETADVPAGPEVPGPEVTADVPAEPQTPESAPRSLTA